MKKLFLNSNVPIKSLLLLVFTVFAAGCGPSASVDSVTSNTVQSSQIYQSYSVDGDRSQTTGSAVFRVGGGSGTTLELLAPSAVSYNGTAMTFSPPGGLFNVRTKGTTYFTRVNNYQETSVFEYTDADGKKYTNSITLPTIEIAQKPPFTLRKSQPATVALSRPVGANERLSLAVNSTIFDGIPDNRNTVYLNQSRTAVIITPEYWADKTLPASVELKIKIAKSETPAQATSIGGSISAEFTAAPLLVSVDNAAKPAANANSAVKANVNKTANTNAANAVSEKVNRAPLNAANQKPANTMKNDVETNANTENSNK